MTEASYASDYEPSLYRPLSQKKSLRAFPHFNSDLGGVDLVRSSLTFGKGSCVRISDIYFFLYAAC